MLYLDCGNTALKCLYQKTFTRFLLNDKYFDDVLNAYLSTLPADTSVVLSSVASTAVQQKIMRQLTCHFTSSIQLATSETSFGTLTSAYSNAQQLGIDRWLGLIASQQIKGTKIIIDAGSWIKMDLLHANGQHQGGIIISWSAQQESTITTRFHIDLTQCPPPATYFGQSTQQCICLAKGNYGLPAMKHFLIHWLAQIRQPCHIILTGGNAPLAHQNIKTLTDTAQKHILNIQIIENLVLSGLCIRYTA